MTTRNVSWLIVVAKDYESQGPARSAVSFGTYRIPCTRHPYHPTNLESYGNVSGCGRSLTLFPFKFGHGVVRILSIFLQRLISNRIVALQTFYLKVIL